jgi:hypothetical protein
MFGFKFRARKQLRLGPLYAWLTPSGITSWGVKWGAFRHNITRGDTAIDTPGPGALHRRRPTRRQRGGR